MKFIEIPEERQKQTIARVQEKNDLPDQIIEKDWWVSAVMRALFALPYAGQLSFKGGTSLSKCWGLIERFSEDIDIAVNREFLGYGGELSRTQISDKLRRAACSFVRERLQFDLKEKMIEQGVPADKFSISVDITPVTTVDPEVICVEYQSIYPLISYVKNAVKIEVSGRSMSEPLEDVQIRSIIEDTLPDAPFSEGHFTVPTVKPERTFLEKLCLLHEEFAKVYGETRVDRMSRHLYDIYQLRKAGITDLALADKELFESIVDHRKKFIGLRGFDYSTLCAEQISIVPPERVIKAWEEDYNQMCEFMAYGDKPSFVDIIAAVTELNAELRIKL